MYSITRSFLKQLIFFRSPDYISPGVCSLKVSVVSLNRIRYEAGKEEQEGFVFNRIFTNPFTFFLNYYFQFYRSSLSPLSWPSLPLLLPATSRSTKPQSTLPRATLLPATLPQPTRITNTPTSSSPANLMSATSTAAANGG